MPQAFGSSVDARPGNTLAQYEDWMLGNLTQYIHWSSLDERVVGFNAWHLLDRPGPTSTSSCASKGAGCGEVGVEGMPRLRTALQALGEEIVQTQPRVRGGRAARRPYASKRYIYGSSDSRFLN